jgi:uncharacterized protein
MRCSVSMARAIALLLLVLPLHALDVPDQDQMVIDVARVVDSASRERMERVIAEVWRRDLAQVKVLTVGSVDGEDFFSFVQRQAERWKLGTEAKDNGVLIALSTGDRAVRIQVGYGLEGVLPDAWCGTVSRQARDRYFRSGAYGPGLAFLVDAVASAIAADARVTLDGVEQPATDSGSPPWWYLIVALVVVFIVMRGMRGPRRGWGGYRGRSWPIGTSGGFGGGRSGWSGGFGGGFRGGGGSFGGGGGGARW